VVYFVFDLLFWDDRDLRKDPVESRKARLEELFGSSTGVIRYVPHVRTEGLKLMAGASGCSKRG
jgi:ATP-dependent DNA ligase